MTGTEMHRLTTGTSTGNDVVIAQKVIVLNTAGGLA